MKSVFYWALSIAAGGVALALGLYLYAFGGFGLGNQESFALFGDFMGGLLNPVLSFATILILLRSLWLQNEEMKAGRRELELTREEMAATREVHSNELELQSRNNLRPQLQKIFSDAIFAFDKGWIKSLSMENIGASISPRSFDSFLRVSQRKGTQYNIEHWDREPNRGAAFFIRRRFRSLWQSGMALVEYSDTSLETDHVRRVFLDARDRMLGLHLQDEAEMEQQLRDLDDMIEKRKAKKFPVFHQGVKI